MAKKRNKSDEPRRKLAERTEVVEVRLTPMQIEDERAKVVDLLQERDELKAAWKSAKDAHKAKETELDSRLETARGAIRAAKIRREITVEEWITDRNEVIRIDKATGEEIGRRTASARELQEDLPFADPPKGNEAEADGDDGEEELAREAADDFGEDA